MFKLAKGIMAVILVTGMVYLIQIYGPVNQLQVSSLLLAILVGAMIKNTIGVPASFKDGIHFCSQRVLRLAVILLGFKLSLGEVSAIGYQAVLLIFIVSGLTLMFTRYIGRKLGVADKLALLLGSGVSICGASAVASVNTVIRSDEKDVAYSIAAITLFGTLFMFFYPLAFKVLHLSDAFYSLWVGTSIHEVAQVVAAGFAASPDIGAEATVVKLTRVLFIIPVTMYLAVVNLGPTKGGQVNLKKLPIPWFVVLFLLAVGINSVLTLSPLLKEVIIDIDNWLMTAAMAALGLGLSFKGIKNMGLRPLLLGMLASIFISVLSAGMVLLHI